MTLNKLCQRGSKRKIHGRHYDPFLNCHLSKHVEYERVKLHTISAQLKLFSDSGYLNIQKGI